MPRQPRHLLPDGTYHVVSRAVHAQWMFDDDHDRTLMTLLLLFATDRFEWDVHCFCLMGTHIHLVVTTTRPDLSAGMKVMLERYANAFNGRYGRTGHLVGDRFWAKPIEDDEQLEATCDYVRLNPVRAGMCERAEDWPWSWNRYEESCPAPTGGARASA